MYAPDHNLGPNGYPMNDRNETLPLLGYNDNGEPIFGQLGQIVPFPPQITFNQIPPDPNSLASYQQAVQAATDQPGLWTALLDEIKLHINNKNTLPLRPGQPVDNPLIVPLIASFVAFDITLQGTRQPTYYELFIHLSRQLATFGQPRYRLLLPGDGPIWLMNQPQILPQNPQAPVFAPQPQQGGPTPASQGPPALPASKYFPEYLSPEGLPIGFPLDPNYIGRLAASQARRVEQMAAYINDGPRFANERLLDYNKRIKRAVENMEIERRPEPRIDDNLYKGKANVNLRRNAAEGMRTANAADSETHKNKLDPRHTLFDQTYVDEWRAAKATRQANNRVKRRRKVAERRAHYSLEHPALQLPDPPEPEDSGDELYDFTFNGPKDGLILRRVPGDPELYITDGLRRDWRQSMVDRGITHAPYICVYCHQNGYPNCNVIKDGVPCTRCSVDGKADNCKIKPGEPLKRLPPVTSGNFGKKRDAEHRLRNRNRNRSRSPGFASGSGPSSSRYRQRSPIRNASEYNQSDTWTPCESCAEAGADCEESRPCQACELNGTEDTCQPENAGVPYEPEPRLDRYDDAGEGIQGGRFENFDHLANSIDNLLASTAPSQLDADGNTPLPISMFLPGDPNDPTGVSPYQAAGREPSVGPPAWSPAMPYQSQFSANPPRRQFNNLWGQRGSAANDAVAQAEVGHASGWQQNNSLGFQGPAAARGSPPRNVWGMEMDSEGNPVAGGSIVTDADRAARSAERAARDPDRSNRAVHPNADALVYNHNSDNFEFNEDTDMSLEDFDFKPPAANAVATSAAAGNASPDTVVSPIPNLPTDPIDLGERAIVPVIVGSAKADAAFGSIAAYMFPPSLVADDTGCEEVANYFANHLGPKDPPSICDLVPTKVCDHIQCTKRVCIDCHRLQNEHYSAGQADCIAATKQHCCVTCKKEMDEEFQAELNELGGGPVAPRQVPFGVFECICARQMRKTWLCQVDREQALLRVHLRTTEGNTKRIAEAGYVDPPCPRCVLQLPVVGSGSWRCYSCGEFVLHIG